MLDAGRLQSIIANSLKPIAGIMEDKTVTEIMVTADGRVWIERRGAIERSDIVLGETDRQLAIMAVAKYTGAEGSCYEWSVHHCSQYIIVSESPD